MRNRFDQELELGRKLIIETPVFAKSRDDIPAIVVTLKHIFSNMLYSNQIYDILEKKIMKGKKQTGRVGLNLWQIFVLAQLRLGANIDYDRLHYMVMSDSIIRQLLGIETESGFPREEISYQRIIDNVSLLDDETMKALNEVIVNFGHKEVYKKKEAEALFLKTDSYVVESNVHFPTDYNLLWDSARKCSDIVDKFCEDYPTIEGWRKKNEWRRSLKILSRTVGRVSGSGGKNKEDRLKECVVKYLLKSKGFSKKIKWAITELPVNTVEDMGRIIDLEMFVGLLDKHIDLLERRVVKGEKIPHGEKLFSIFEQYTEWITKGKKRPSVELGKRLSITTDQNGLIIDYEIHENTTDSEVVLDIAVRVLSKYNIKSWSFDKGYWNKDMKDLLDQEIDQVVMPKKGKRNQKQNEEESAPTYKKLRNVHSAVESNINELEHRGLDRCPDRGYHGYKRYIGIGVVAYNLHKIGKVLLGYELIRLEQEAVENKLKLLQRAA